MPLQVSSYGGKSRKSNHSRHRGTEVGMTQPGRIRPFAADDLGQVVALFDRAYLSGAGTPSEQRSALFRRVFLAAPDRSEGALPSLVWEDPAGHVLGFCGAHPRRFVLDGTVILAAAPGQLMVAPEARARGIGVALVRAFFAGPQSFTFNGSASDATRAITGALGAVNPPLRGIRWRIANAKAQPISAEGNSGNRASLAAELADVCDRAFRGLRLVPAHDPELMAWKLETLALTTWQGSRARIVHRSGAPVGWYVLLLDAEETAVLADFIAPRDAVLMVLAEMLSDAAASGAREVTGYCQSWAQRQALETLGAEFETRTSKYLFHSNLPALTARFPEGPDHLSAFDGEAWLRFP